MLPSPDTTHTGSPLGKRLLLHRIAARPTAATAAVVPGALPKEPIMLNLTAASVPALLGARSDAGFLGKLVLWARQRIRYERALYELHRLDDRDLDDLGIARGDFPSLAWRHAT